MTKLRSSGRVRSNGKAVPNKLIRFNNFMTRLRRVRVAPENLLLLAPHCLQVSVCKQNVAAGIDACRRCGKCDVADLLEIRDKYGIQCHVAGGGRQAIGLVKQSSVKAVVAVACEKELALGIKASFPKPVLAVSNQLPNGPCKDTCVTTAIVDAAVREMLGLGR